MKLVIQSPGIKLSNKLTNRASYKANHLTRIYERINSCFLVFKKQNHEDKRNYQVSVEVMVPGKILFAAHYAETFEAALADAFAGVSHQLRRFKEELNVHQ